MEIPDDGGVCRVEGNGVSDGPNRDGGPVRVDADRKRRERDYRWYRR